MGLVLCAFCTLEAARVFPASSGHTRMVEHDISTVTGTWDMIRSNAYCSERVRKNLADSTTLSACQSMVLSDPDCSSVMYSDGQICRCLRIGQVCDFETRFAGANNVYRYETRSIVIRVPDSVPPSP